MTSDFTPHDIIVFDGVCNLCSGFVRLILRLDACERFRFASAQSALGARLLEEHGLDSDDVPSVLLISGGTAYARSDAALQIARHLRCVWLLAAVFTLIPRSLRDRCYRLVANNRYRWFGRRDRCMVPSRQVSARFLD